MNIVDLLVESVGRVHGGVHDVVDGLSPTQLAFRPDDHANSIAWLVWHLTRVQDDHVASVAARAQTWMAEGWARRFALPLDAGETGYGQDAVSVGLVQADANLLGGYYDAVHAQTVSFLTGQTERDLDRIVDERWDPPVTLGVRLVSVIDDDVQHVGQAAFVRGLGERCHWRPH